MADSDARSKPEHAARASGSPGGQPQVISAISNFEDSLQNLKRLYADAQAQQAELDRRSEDLRARESEVEQQREALRQAQEGLARDSRAAEEAEQAGASLRAELERRASELDKRGADVQRAAEELRRERSEFDRSREQADREHADARKRSGEAEQAVQALSKRQQELEQSIRVSTEAADRRSQELQQLRSELDARAKELTQVSERRGGEERVLAEREQRLAQREHELEETKTSLETERGEIESLRGRVRAAEELAAQRAAQVERAIARAGELGADLGKTLIRAAELEAQLAEAKRSRPEDKGDTARREEVEQLRRKMTLVGEVLHEYEQLWSLERGEVKLLAQALQARAEEIAELEAVLVQLRERVKAELSARAARGERAEAAAPGELAGKIAAVSADQADAVRHAELTMIELRQKLEEEFSLRQEAQRRADAAEAARATLEEKLDKTASRLKATQSELQKSLRDRPSFGPSERNDRLDRRASRLKLYRSLVRDRAEKLRRAGETIKKRYEACEQLLQQRAELATAAAAISQAQKRLARRTASGRVGMAVFCVSAAMGIMATLSWMISRETFPGRYAAVTELRADTHERPLNAGELRDWQKYHEDLVKDPRFADAVAKRMARKGMAEMGTAAIVSQRIGADLAVESGQDGVVRLELKGDGPDRTERELDTIATTLASEANASRTQRMDGAATTPPTPAKAGARPIDTTQLTAAGFMFGGGMAITIVIAVSLWRRLASAKTKFEQDAHIAAALDESKWVDPEKKAAA